MKYSITGLFIGAAAVLALSSCTGDQESLHNFENKVYISADSFKDEVRVAVDENVQTMSREVTVAMAMPESHDVEVSFRTAPELVDTYRLAYYDSDAELLPEAYYTLNEASALIKSGDVVSEPIAFDFLKLDQLDYTKHYVLPVTIESATDMEVLTRSKTIYYVVKEASLVNVVADINSNLAYPVWDGFSPVTDMQTFTFEALVLGYAFTNSSKVHTIMGIEDNFLLRVGDTTIPTNQIQLAYAVVDEEDNTIHRGSVTSTSLQLKTDRWYHIAVTFDNGDINVYLDGKLRASGNSTDIGLSSVDFSAAHSDEMDNKPRCFWIGYSYNDERCWNGMISEVRVWNKALTEEEINAENHFYKIMNPQDEESLVAYWKFNEGTGSTVTDYSSSGKNLTGDHDFVWMSVELPSK